MFSILLHPEIGDTPGGALIMWLLFAGIVVVVIGALYFAIKLLRSFSLAEQDVSQVIALSHFSWASHHSRRPRAIQSGR